MTGLLTVVLTAGLASAGPRGGATMMASMLRLRGCLPTITETIGGVNYTEVMDGTVCRQTLTAYVTNGEPLAKYLVSYKGTYIATLETDTNGSCSCTLTGASELGRTPPLPMLRQGYIVNFGEYTVCMN
jgi:hypothetical protein